VTASSSASRSGVAVPAQQPGPAHAASSRRLFALTLTALGVVYGDIGTSPLYTIRECFYRAARVPVTPENVLGVLSLIVYALVIVISIKYIAIVMRADNQGEGASWR
jgi:KUP system potassium uptake protein